MKPRLHTVFLYSVTVFAVTLFFACESNFRDIQKINFSEFIPSGDADSVNLKYTDSGRVKSILVSPKMLDYGTVSYPFTEFPKGVDVTLFDAEGKKSFIRSDYAVTFKGTDIIDLRGNVKLTSPENQFLETEQLYYDQKNEWFFTEKRFKFTDEKAVTTGEGIDFRRDFQRIKFKNVYSEIDELEE